MLAYSSNLNPPKVEAGRPWVWGQFNAIQDTWALFSNKPMSWIFVVSQSCSHSFTTSICYFFWLLPAPFNQKTPTLFFSGKNPKSKFFPFHKKIFSLERATHRLHSGLSIGKKIQPVSFLCSPHSRLSFTHFIHFPFTLCPSAIKSHSRFILMPKATHRASARYPRESLTFYEIITHVWRQYLWLWGNS